MNKKQIQEIKEEMIRFEERIKASERRCKEMDKEAKELKIKSEATHKKLRELL